MSADTERVHALLDSLNLGQFKSNEQVVNSLEMNSIFQKADLQEFSAGDLREAGIPSLAARKIEAACKEEEVPPGGGTDGCWVLYNEEYYTSSDPKNREHANVYSERLRDIVGSRNAPKPAIFECKQGAGGKFLGAETKDRIAKYKTNQIALGRAQKKGREGTYADLCALCDLCEANPILRTLDGWDDIAGWTDASGLRGVTVETVGGQARVTELDLDDQEIASTFSRNTSSTSATSDIRFVCSTARIHWQLAELDDAER
jgi:hypothetical protein